VSLVVHKYSETAQKTLHMNDDHKPICNQEIYLKKDNLLRFLQVSVAPLLSSYQLLDNSIAIF